MDDFKETMPDRPTFVNQRTVSTPRRQQSGNVGHVLVFVSCLLTAMISMGTAFGMGSIYLDIVETFKTSRPLAALVGSLSVGLGFGAGILTGPILGQVGGAVTMFAGSMLGCVGCIGSSFAPNIFVLIFCLGCLTGVGVSCCYLSVQITMGLTFERHRHLTVSMVTVSAGLGSTAFPYLLRTLVEAYTLRGAFLILAGLFFHITLSAAVVRTFAVTKAVRPQDTEFELEVFSDSGAINSHGVEENKKTRKNTLFELFRRSATNNSENHADRDSGSGISMTDLDKEVEVMMMNVGRLQASQGQANEGFENSEISVAENRIDENHSTESQFSIVKRSRSTASLPEAESRSEAKLRSAAIPGQRNLMTKSKSTMSLQNTAARPRSLQQRSGSFTSAETNEQRSSDFLPLTKSRSHTLLQKLADSRSRSDTSQMSKSRSSAYLHRDVLRLVEGSPISKSISTGNLHKNVSGPQGVQGQGQAKAVFHKSASVVTISEDVKIYGETTGGGKLRDSESVVTLNDFKFRSRSSRMSLSRMSRRSSFSQAFQPALFYNTPYVLITVACYTAFMTVQAPGFFLVDIAKGRGLSVEQGTQLLSVLWGCNVAGRGVIGLLQLKWKIPVLMMLGCSVFSCGLVAVGYCMLDFVTDSASIFPAYMAMSALYGLIQGTMVTLSPLSCLELVGIEQYAPALGYQYFVGGTCSALGGPLGGWLKDITGSYNAIFYIVLAQGVVALATTTAVTCRHRGKPKLQPRSGKSESRSTSKNESSQGSCGGSVEFSAAKHGSDGEKAGESLEADQVFKPREMKQDCKPREMEQDCKSNQEHTSRKIRQDHASREIRQDHTSRETRQDPQEHTYREIHQDPTSREIRQDPISREIRQDPASREIHQDPASREIHQDPASREIHQDPASREIHQDPTSREIHQDPASREIHQDPTSREIHQDQTSCETRQDNMSREIPQDHTYREIRQDPTSREIHQDPTSRDIDQDPTSREIHQDPTSREIHQDPTSREIHQDPTSREIHQDQTSRERQRKLGVCTYGGNELNDREGTAADMATSETSVSVPHVNAEKAVTRF